MACSLMRKPPDEEFQTEKWGRKSNMAVCFNQHLQKFHSFEFEKRYHCEWHTVREARGEAVMARNGGSRYARREKKCN